MHPGSFAAVALPSPLTAANYAPPNLPTTASGGLAPISTPLSDMFMFTLEGPQSLEEKRTVLDWVIRPQLRGLPGVADVNSLGKGEDPHWLYTVRFDGRELWGTDGDPTLTVSVDAWEPYLERA